MKQITHTAILALLALPAAARGLDGAVTVYGTLLPFADNVRVAGATAAPPSEGATQVPGTAYTGATTPQRFRLGSGTSNLGFKGGLDLLGEDLQAFFQVESAVSVDAADSPNAWASRNSGVGVKGKFGRIVLGNWDTPYKYPTPMVGALRGLLPFENALVGNPGFGVPATTTQSGRGNAKADAAFNRRQGNSVQYWSPELHGITGRVAVSVNEAKTAATSTAPSVSPTLYSGVISYVKGPLTLRYAYERHQDYFGLSQLGGSAGATAANDSSTDQGHLVVAQVSLPTGTRLSGMAERLSYENADGTPGVVSSYERYAFFALAQQRFGDHQVWASYGLASRGSCDAAGGGACTTEGLGASQFGVGYSRAFGKSFDLYGAYYQLVNDRAATYGVVGGPAVAPGGDTRGLGIGLLYTFSATATAGAPSGL